ncbi:DUF4407 domain-containing protein [Thauera sp. JM12B12]|uniref:DUF4407 domain-containing protein n=1 Tax=Thauera sp. JM12B12 TaxID=3142262 RepID=UPI0031F3508C
MSTDSKQYSGIERVRYALARFMAVCPHEWELIQTAPRLASEIVFHALAIIYCALFFAWAVFNIALGAFGYPLFAAALFGVTAGTALATIDRHVRIQTRGAPNVSRLGSYVVRIGSLFIVAISAFLMSMNTFHDDIDRVLARQSQAQRAQIEQDAQFRPELEAARQAVSRTAAAAARADQLQAAIAQMVAEQAQEWANERNECEGNVTGNVARVRGCGTKAGGHRVNAERLGRQIDAARQELAQLGDVETRSADARARLSAINTRIDAEVRRIIGGHFKRVEALLQMTFSEPAAQLTVGFWLLVGMLPEMMMWIALNRSANDETFALVRRVQDRALAAQMARYSEQLRDVSAEGLKPLEVRLAAVPAPRTRDTARVSNEQPSQKELAS